MKICPVILCGGSGTRLWPLSRTLYPKQFIDMGGHSLFGDTLRRVKTLEKSGEPIILCNQEQRFLAAASLREEGIAAQIILEPEGRNTAPAIAAAALAAAEKDDPLLLVLPSDHVIRDAAKFVESVSQARECAEQGMLAVFGVTPGGPETGYGYIESGEAFASGFRVKRFVEKPGREQAEAMLQSGGCLWNSGMFLFRASRYLEELERYAPRICASVKKAWSLRAADPDFIRLEAGAFAACPSDSVDYAVMEKTDRAVMVRLEAGWSDVGSWGAMYEEARKDEHGNACMGDVLALNATGNYVHAANRLVAVADVTDLIVVETRDAVLVSKRTSAQGVKNIVTSLKARGRTETETHVRVLRPWGSYETLVTGENFLVKRLIVNPGASLSLQLHYHRAEHWVVVRGTGEITVGEETLLLGEDQSTYIPLGTRHRLSNPGRIPLEIIEVQSGNYLKEDDIVRFEDTYGRL